jgi:hypothetical protein
MKLATIVEETEPQSSGEQINSEFANLHKMEEEEQGPNINQ